MDRKSPCTRYTLLLGLAAISLFWFLIFSYFTISLSNQLIAVKNAINLQDIASSDFTEIGERLPTINRDITILNSVGWPVVPIIKTLSYMPGVGPYADQIIPVYRYFSTIARAGNSSYPHLLKLLTISEMNLPVSELIEQLYLVSFEGKSDFRNTAEMLDQAELMRANIDPTNLPVEVKILFDSLDQYAQTAIQVFHLLPVLPEMLGTPEASVNYLLLAQNRDELRGTGGFITGIGTLQLEAGKLINLNIADSYLVDDFSKGYPPPPDPIRKFMLAGYWVPRDGNWNPDFPTSAQVTQALYELSTGQVTHGVIAFDQDAMISMIRLVGPISMADFTELVSGDNIEYLMQQARAPSGDESGEDWLTHRKDFMAPIGEALFRHLMQVTDRQTLLKLGAEFLAAIESGHILLYFNQPEAQRALVSAGLDNALDPGNRDFLMLVDSNIGFNKADAVVERSLTYLVDLSTPEYIPAMLITHYTHTVQEDVSCEFDPDPGNFFYNDTQNRCYLDYWRVYIQPVTQLFSSNHTPIPGSWLVTGEDWSGEVKISNDGSNLQEISGLFMLPTAQSQDVVLQFLHPPQWLEQTQDGLLNYNLKVQKQAGLSTLPLILQINPPPGHKLIDSGPDWRLDSQTGFWVWEGQITESQIFDIHFQPAE